MNPQWYRHYQTLKFHFFINNFFVFIRWLLKKITLALANSKENIEARFTLNLECVTRQIIIKKQKHFSCVLYQGNDEIELHIKLVLGSSF